MGARFGFAFAGLLAFAGCGGPAVMRAPSPPPCATRTPASHPADTLTVVLFDSVDPSHAPWGHNREERFVFSHLYESLLTVDCRGQLQPALAKRWLPASDGWLIEMRDDARFWDQTPVTAYEAADGIKRAIAEGIAIQSVDVIDEHSMIIHGYSGRPDLKLLTLQMLAVTKASSNGVVPIGSGPWMLDETVPLAEAVVIHPSGEVEFPVVRFVQGNVSDARDIMDGTADAMITDDPAAIEYARSKKTASLAPLAWDRAYMLLSWTRVNALRERLRTMDPGNAFPLHDQVPQVQDALAKNAVQVDARGGSALLRKAEDMSVQREISHPVANDDPSPLVLYVHGDATARELAERIVALATMDTSSVEARRLPEAVPDLPIGIRASGVETAQFERSLARGSHIAYVVRLSWDADFPLVMHQFVDRASWAVSDRVTLRGSMFPLVETRAHFIAISDRVGYIDDHNGGVRILGPSVVKVR